MKTLIVNAQAALQAASILSYITDTDIVIVPNERLLPIDSTFPMIAIKDGRVEKELSGQGGVWEVTYYFDVIPYVEDEGGENTVIGTDPNYGVYTVRGDVVETLLNEALGSSGMLLSYVPREEPDEWNEGEDISLISKKITFSHSRIETISGGDGLSGLIENDHDVQRKLMVAVRDSLKSSSALDYVLDNDIFITTNEDLLPMNCGFPAIGIKGGPCDREISASYQSTKDVWDCNYNIDIIVYQLLTEGETPIVGQTSPEIKGVLEIREDVHTALHDKSTFLDPEAEWDQEGAWADGVQWAEGIGWYASESAAVVKGIQLAYCQSEAPSDTMIREGRESMGIMSDTIFQKKKITYRYEVQEIL